MQFVDPFTLKEMFWPDVYFYREQREVIQSVVDNPETFCVAGNVLGKDFVTAFIMLWFFLTRDPCRIVATSVDNDQLEGVLWGEINHFIEIAKHPLDSKRGGPLEINHLHIRKIRANGKRSPKSYLRLRVAKRGEGMLGHHLPRHWGLPWTMFVSDEASGVEDISFDRADTWAHRKLIIGNPFPCQNFFYRGVEEGTKVLKNGKVMRKVIHISADQSPNVRFAMAQIKEGVDPTYQILVPGVKDYATYLENLETWDEVKQCIQLQGKFWKGGQFLLYPPSWLDLCCREGDSRSLSGRKAKAIGVDTAEGGDASVWTAVDEFGVLEQVSEKTPDTSVIPEKTLTFMYKWGCRPEQVFFDAGGGGKEHVDILRKEGHNVQTVAFGGAPTSVDKFKRLRSKSDRIDESENRQVYLNRRAEMYDLLRQQLNPANKTKFGIPSHYRELRRQLSPIPLLYDKDGKMRMLPKNKTNKDSKEQTLTELLGRSPDEADSLVLAVFGMLNPLKRHKIGAVGGKAA